MSRTLRRWTTWIAIAGFAFSQAVFAVYACPVRGPMLSAAVAADADVGAAEGRCSGHAGAPAPATGPLCEAHCEGQTGATGGSPLVVPPVALAPFPFVVGLGDDPVAIARAGRTPCEANAAAPPRAQRFCKLLI